jgi:Fe2+ transport system protein FeoA
MSTVKLSEFAINKQGVIVEIMDNPVAAKLVEFGIMPGAHFYIVNKASFDGPIFIQVGSNRLALRQSEASAILVE